MNADLSGLARLYEAAIRAQEVGNYALRDEIITVCRIAADIHNERKPNQTRPDRDVDITKEIRF